MITLDFLGHLLSDAFWSGMATLGFAVLFNVPRRTLLGCVICGAIGHAIRTLLMELGLRIEFSTLIGATVVGFMGTAFAHRWQTPATIFSISGAIPLVPGVFAFRTMLGFLNVAAASDVNMGTVALVEASINAVTTGLILGAIAVGIAAPTLIFERRKPVT